MNKKTNGQRRIVEISTANQARAEYDAATQGLAFTKDFRALDALIQDRMATAGERIYAWIRRRAWGNYRLYCINDDNKPAFQRDCAKDTGLCKQTISSTIKYLETRGYVRTEGKFLYPVLTPTPQPPEKYKKVSHSPDFSDFLEQWKVSHSTDFQELEVARETVKRLEKVKLSLYKEWVTSRTNALRTLYESGRVSESIIPAGERAPLENNAPPVEDPLARTPQEDSQQLLGRRRHDAPDWHDRVANYLEILPIPTVLDKPMLMQITKTLSEEFVEQFIAAVDPKKGTAYAATSKDGKGIRNWAGVLSIAKQVVARGVVNTLAPRPGGKPLACGFCNKPIEGGAINGSHFECWEAATQQVDARRSALEDAKGTAT